MVVNKLSILATKADSENWQPETEFKNAKRGERRVRHVVTDLREATLTRSDNWLEKRN